MIIKFKSLELSNFMSFEYAKIVLDNNGFVKVLGENKNKIDNSKSNGSGKSAIWEALNWCFTGETLRGSKNVVRNGYEDGCFVTVNCTCDTFSYEITRSKNHKKLKTNLFIKKDGEDISGKGIRDTEIILKNVLPELTSELINSIIILGQGLPMRFTNNTPSGRKEVLEKLSKSDFMIEDIKERVSNRKTELTSKLQDFKLKEVALSTEFDICDSQCGNKLRELDSYKSTDISYLTDEKNKLEMSEKNINDDISTIIGKYDKPIDDIIKNLNDKKLYENTFYHNKLSELNKKYEPLFENLKIKLSENETLKRVKSEEVIKLKSISDVCPTCGQKLPNVHKVDTTDLENYLVEIEKNITNYSDELSRLKDEKIAESENLKNEFDTLNLSLNDKLNEVESDRIKVNELRNELTELCTTIEELNFKILSREEKIKTIESDLKSLSDKIDELKSELNFIHEQIEDLDKRISIQKDFETAIKRDFRGILLQNCISYINNKAKEYCKKIFDTELISFALDGNNISISYDGKEYEAMSGGEKQKIDLIIQFSIRSMLCKYLNFSCNLLVLDELTDNIDLPGCNKVMNFISDVVSDVDSVFIISHHENLELPFDNILSIVKNEQGISSVI